MTYKFTDSLRYICCIIVVFSHMGYKTAYLPLGSMHFLAVACFFFLAGYGIYCSYNRYQKSFYRRHVIKSLEYLGMLGIFVFFKGLLNIPIWSGGILFLVIIVIFTAMFLLITKIFETKRLRMIAIVIVFGLVFPSGLRICNIPKITNWAAQSSCYAMGLVIAEYHSYIEKIFRNKWANMIMILIVFFSSAMYYLLNKDFTLLTRVEYVMRYLIIYSMLFLIISISLHFEIGNEISVFIGKRSLYIYMFHGIITEIVKKKSFYANMKIGVTVMSVASILCGICMYEIYVRIKLFMRMK